MLSSSTSQSEQLIEVHEVHRRTLCGVSFICPSNCTTSIVGPSGCGKSTLLRIMAGLESPDCGSVLLGNECPARRQTRGEIGFAFQAPTLMAWRTVRKNIELPLEILHRGEFKGLSDVLRLTRLDENNLAAKLPKELSGGQAHRVSLARALVTGPQFLFLDEPFTGTDFQLRRTLNAEMMTWLRTIKTTAVLVTHDPHEAAVMSDHVIVLSPPPTRVLLEKSARCINDSKNESDINAFAKDIERALEKCRGDLR
jgi:NitT/TauT family transport system ATP-binding protein